MITFKVGVKGAEGFETLFLSQESVPYMPVVGDRIICLTDRVGLIEKRILAYDEDADLTVTFMVVIEPTTESEMKKWTILGSLKQI